MDIKEAPRCVSYDELVAKRGNMVESCITGMLGITNDEYLELWFDLGCEYAEFLADKEGNAARVERYVRNNLFWYYWVERWLEQCETYIEWHYPEKTIEEFKDIHRGGLPPMRVFEMLKKTTI